MNNNLKLAPILFNKLMDKLSVEELELVKKISRNGFLRSKSPKVEYIEAGKTLKFKVPEIESAKAGYLWSRAAYYLSPYKKDHASPPNPMIYFGSNAAEANKDRLDEISDIILKGTPKEFHYGPISRGEI
jgi:hypothetical protein